MVRLSPQLGGLPGGAARELPIMSPLEPEGLPEQGELLWLAGSLLAQLHGGRCPGTCALPLLLAASQAAA